MADINTNYKVRHKPIQHSDKVKYHQSYYYPQNPEKCLTSINVCRSGWERLFCQWCDLNPNVTFWASEPVAIKYLNPVANLEYCMKQGLNPNDPHNWKVCNYYTDFWMEIIDQFAPEGKRRIYVEIKPEAQCHPPKPLTESASLKERKAFNNAAQTWLVNDAKWKAAREYFAQQGAEFWVVHEKILRDNFHIDINAAK